VEAWKRPEEERQQKEGGQASEMQIAER